ncbi:MAG: SAM-dependent methyltransferase [Pseudarcicella sp.]|nr:SAM-dependent methyltransferase [Pseudarcicella sp.]
MKMLYLIPTFLAPNTLDKVLAPQIKNVVSETQYFLVENIRTARRFISELKTGKTIDELSFFLLDKDTSLQTVKSYFKTIPTGKNIGVISEAGCPGVADPGALAVEVAHRLGMKVIPLVGPSSILLGLMASGFSGQSFVFHGYLPIDKAERTKKIKTLETDSRKGQTQIFMETPFRNNQLLADIFANCQGATKLCIATDITDTNEFVQTKTIGEWVKATPDLHKRPTMFFMAN